MSSFSSLSAKDVVLQIVCPFMGAIMANLMFSAPYKDLQNAVRKGQLGDLNPTPWAFMLGNCIGWVTYAILLNNLWIYFANCPGLLLSIWLNLGATKLLYSGHHTDQIRASFVTFLQQNTHTTSTTRTRTSTTTKQTRRGNDGDAGGGDDNCNDSNDDDDENNSNHEETIFFSTNSFRLVPNSTSGNHQNLQLRQQRNPSIGSTSDNGPNVPAAAAAAVANDTATTTMQPSGATTAIVDWARVVWDVTSQTTPAPAPHERMILGIVIIWTIVISIISFASSLDGPTKELIVGTVVNLNLVFFYGAPLSSIVQVLKEQSSSSIHIPTMITNTLCATFWFAYGFAILDFFIIVPNGLGTLLGCIQIALCVIFPRKGNRKDIATSHTKKDDDGDMKELQDTDEEAPVEQPLNGSDTSDTSQQNR